MKKSLLLLLIMSGVIRGFSQNIVHQEIERLKKGASSVSFSPFKRIQIRSSSMGRGVFPTEKRAMLELDSAQLTMLVKARPQRLTLAIPQLNSSESLYLELMPSAILDKGFKILDSHNREVTLPSDRVHYWGIINNDAQSLASVTVINGELSAIISSPKGNIALTKLANSSQYVVYKDTTTLNKNFSCSPLSPPITKTAVPAIAQLGTGCKYIPIYFEADNATYISNGSSVVNTVSYITKLFNQVALLYHNEGLSVMISQIKVWDTPDPYLSNTAPNTVMDAFRAYLGTNFVGNIAHLLSTRSLGGGVGYLGVLDFKTYAFGVSGSLSASVENVPAFSWDVEEVTHELGHNLGSPHTHNCSWPGGPIDNCYNAEGTCAAGPSPTNGGTIMSYCHITDVGINFNNGFGTLPGNLIRSNVATAISLPTASDVPTTLVQTLSTTSLVDVAWSFGAGSSTFTVEYKPTGSATWIVAGTTKANVFRITGLTTNTSYDWRVKGDCSTYSSSTFTTNNVAPTYCTPTFTTGCGGGTGVGITSIKLNNVVISSSATCSTGGVYFANNTASPVSLLAGNTYSFEVAPLSVLNPKQLGIWVDFNGDYVMDASEQLFLSTSPNTGNFIGNFTIPSTVISRQGVRMRFLINFYDAPAGACATYTYGEAEDYVVNLQNCTNTMATSLSSSTICQGLPVTLTTSGCGGTLSWTNSTATTASITVSPMVTTNYVATCTSSGCSASSVSFPVTVTSVVTPTVSSATSSTICKGTSITLTATGCTGTLAWTNSTATTASITVSPTVTTNYVATCTVSGCSALSVAFPVTVTNVATPTVSAATSSTICKGTSITLTATGCTGTLAWTNSTATTTSMTVSPTVTTNYVATCTVSGCSASSVAFPVTVTTVPTPIVSSATSSTICKGTSITLTATGCTGTLAWTNSTATTTSITVSPTVTTNYVATCTVSGCSASSVAFPVTVTTVPTPIVSSATSSTICKGTSITLTATGCTGTLAWTNSTATTASITVSPTATTNYVATCTLLGCSASSVAFPVTVTTVPTPIVSSATSSTVCKGTSITLTATGCTGTLAWTNSTATAASITVSPTVTTNYVATCTVSGCSASSVAFPVTVVTISPPTISPSNFTICTGQSKSITASGCTGSILWGNGPTTASISVSSAGTYYASCMGGGCTSTYSNIAYVSVNDTMYTLKTGDWTDTSVWSCGRVPLITDITTITANTTVTITDSTPIVKQLMQYGNVLFLGTNTGLTIKGN